MGTKNSKGSKEKNRKPPLRKESSIFLDGSCHCRKVRFRLRSSQIYPYQRCYCSICRKTQGGGGYAINLSGEAETLEVQGRQHVKVYRAWIQNPEDEEPYHSTAERSFCGKCGSALWLFSPEWPELIHPFASAVDTPLPVAPDHTHVMLEFKAPWVELHVKARDQKFQRYADESIAEWHERHHLTT